MNRAQHRSTLAALALVTTAAFAACSSLDDRKVTRGPDVAVGGDGPEHSGGSGTGDEPSVGGGGSRGGEGPDSPFGGETFMGGSPAVDGPPEVVEVDPKADAEDVNPNGAISLLFSEGLDPATVTTENIRILDEGREVEGEVSYDNGVATFEPASRLSLLATYEVNVSNAVTDTGGQALKEPFAASFTVRDGTWGRQGSVNADPTLVGSHASATDAQGNVLIAYTGKAPTNPSLTTVFARWVRASTTALGEEIQLEDNGLGCNGVKVAVDADGNAVAIWQSGDGKQAYLRARRFVDGAWERTAQNVAQDGATATMTSANSSAVAIGGGQIAVAWTRYFYQTVGNYAAHYTSVPLKGAWPSMPASHISTSNSSEYLDSTQIALDAKGTVTAMFTWHASAGTYKGVYFARRAPGMEWEYPTKIPSSNVPSSYLGGPVLASDGEGAMAVWLDYINYEYHLKASRYTKAKQFSEPIEIGDPQVIGNAKLASPGGLATNGQSYWVTWTQALGSSQNVYVKRFDVASGTWDAEPTLVSDGVANTDVAVIGVDAHGNAVAAYDQSATGNTLLILGARYAAASRKWADPAPLTDAGTYFTTPLLTVAGSGVASLLFSSSQNESMPAAKNMHGLYRIFK
ncbi:MAG: hypothetical protein EOO73_01385 [Myxococcales bacterium]|nr:MAG: hypothetical protein EOO73_01385 [Myxococcales bacterium]